MLSRTSRSRIEHWICERRIITGFQLRTSCVRNSGNMGAEGDPPLALKSHQQRAGAEQRRSPCELSGNLRT
jgi:hypothetical protein